MKIYIETYGCTLNQADSDIIVGLLEARGHKLVTNEDESDVVIVNTCTVKNATESKILERLKQLKKKGKKVVVTGCLTVNKEKIHKFSPCSPIVGTSSLPSINNAVEDAMEGKNTEYTLFESKSELTRVFTAPLLRIPINDGCTSNCYFCQTKIARPFLRSYTPKTIVKWMEEGIAKGAVEIQLTSMDSGAYGIDLKTNLAELLKQILAMKENFRLRLGMINPNHAKRLKEAIADAMEDKRIYKFIHIPVQSGSEKICKAMNRDHTVKEFVELVNYFRSRFPSIVIATDIIVGYPGESEEDFQATCQLLEATRPTLVNISKYSPRARTKAQKMKQLPTQKLRERSNYLNLPVKKMQTEENMKLIGQTFNVLVTEKGNRGSEYKGRDDCYRQVVVKNFKGKIGDSAKVKITDANFGSLIGEAV